MLDERLASMSPDELRSTMRSLGYRTQHDLAQAIGVSRSAVSLWLEGKVGVPRPVAMLLRMLVAAQRRAFSRATERSDADALARLAWMGRAIQARRRNSVKRWREPATRERD